MDAIAAAEAGNAGTPSAIPTLPADEREPERVSSTGGGAGDVPEAEVGEDARRGERIFEVQLGLFHSERNALALIEDFSRRGQDPYVVEVVSSRGETRYTVRLGPYASIAEATRMAARLQQDQGLETVIRYRSRPGQID